MLISAMDNSDYLAIDRVDGILYAKCARIRVAGECRIACPANLCSDDLSFSLKEKVRGQSYNDIWNVCQH